MESSTTATTKASKHQSIDMAGSVFLISSAGNVLRLPIPSNSPYDPLAWSWPRRIIAFCCLQLFSVVASFEVNIPGTLMPAFHAEFAKDVPAGLSITSLSSALTLGVGIGYLINIPLATAIGRRPVVIMSALITAIATLAAGLAGNFLQLLVALAFQGFAVGGTIGMVMSGHDFGCHVHPREAICAFALLVRRLHHHQAPDPADALHHVAGHRVAQRVPGLVRRLRGLARLPRLLCPRDLLHPAPRGL
ncbi:hypothetical protein G7054_g15138 [Neopestalotiopsis clavispora]|nr:hypothetical protein G7054_g15138 [Neopestalotiopsis clavispora]